MAGILPENAQNTEGVQNIFSRDKFQGDRFQGHFTAGGSFARKTQNKARLARKTQNEEKACAEDAKPKQGLRERRKTRQIAGALNPALAQSSNSEKFAGGAENLNKAIQSGNRDEAMRIIETLKGENAKRRKIVQVCCAHLKYALKL